MYAIQAANSKGADQTARMRKTGFLMTWLSIMFILLQLFNNMYFKIFW